MRNTFTSLIVAAVAMLLSLSASAQIDNLVNLSAEWVRCGTRNAALDGADIMAYNPGGVSRLKPGFHLSVGNQSAFRDPKHEYTLDLGAGPTTYSHQQDGADPFTPNIYLSYNKDKWAVFGGVNIVAGGGTANFPQGSISTDLITLGTIAGAGGAFTSGENAYLKASMYEIAGFVGGSYMVNDKFSFGVAVRYVSGTSTNKAGVTFEDSSNHGTPLSLNYTTSASGVGVVLGVDVKPMEKFNIAVRYESQVKLNYKTDSIQDDFDLIRNGQMARRDLPAVLGLGLAYDVTDKLKFMFDFNYYFQTQANWDSTHLATGTVATSSLAGNASTYALSAQYKITKKFLWSLGGVYSLFSYKNQAAYFTNLGTFEIDPTNNFVIATGFAYNPVEKIRINVGVLEALYQKQTIQSLSYAEAGLNVNVKTSNHITAVGIGVDFLF